MHDFVTDILHRESNDATNRYPRGGRDIHSVLLGSGSTCTSGNSEGLGQDSLGLFWPL